MLRHYSEQLRQLLLLVDVLLCAAVFGLAVVALERGALGAPNGPAPDPWQLGALGLVSILSWPILLEHWRLYVSRREGEFLPVLRDLGAAGLAATVLLGASAFLLGAPVSPAFPLLCAGGQLLVLGGLRVLLFGGLRVARRAGRNYRNVLILGSGPRAHAVGERIGLHPEWGLRILGYVDESDVPNDARIPSEAIRKIVDIPDLLRDEVVDEMIVACPRAMLAEIGPVVQACGQAGVPITILADLFGDYLPAPRVRHFDSLAALSFAPVHHSPGHLAVKRALDVVLGTVGIVLAAPIIGAAALAIRLTSSGPVFFGQVRCGLNGRHFTMWKLRTMDADAESRLKDLVHLNEMDGPVFKIRNDPRVTRVGHFLRRTSLDELPQFWNVVRGDMSLVGPRPPVPQELAQYRTTDRRRISMRPGLTCLWQVCGRNDVAAFSDWVKLDLEYIDTWSLGNDLRILLRTIPAVLRGSGAS